MVPTVTDALAVESRRIMSLTTTGRVTGLLGPNPVVVARVYLDAVDAPPRPSASCAVSGHDPAAPPRRPRDRAPGWIDASDPPA